MKALTVGLVVTQHGHDGFLRGYTTRIRKSCHSVTEGRTTGTVTLALATAISPHLLAAGVSRVQTQKVGDKSQTLSEKHRVYDGAMTLLVPTYIPSQQHNSCVQSAGGRCMR